MYFKPYIFILLLFLATETLDAKSILYKVTSPTSIVYILGSIHLAKAELYPLKKPIEEAYTETDNLVVELDPSTPHALQVIQNTILHSGIYPTGKTLKTELTSKTYRMLKQYLEKVGLSLQAMLPMRPWSVMLQLSVMEMMRLGYSPNLGIDKHFIDKAKKTGKSILEIESAEEQMALLSKDEKIFQDLLLRYTIQEMHQMEPLLNKMFKNWKAGDARSLAELLKKRTVDPRMDEIYDLLITKRNDKMKNAILGYLKTTESYFVIVGAGHVVGSQGVVSLLRRDGFKVIQQ